MKIAGMGEGRTEPCEECALVRKRRDHVTQQIGSTTRSSHGACLIPVTDIITGRGCTVDWSGMGSLVRQSPIQNQWESR